MYTSTATGFHYDFSPLDGKTFSFWSEQLSSIIYLSPCRTRNHENQIPNRACPASSSVCIISDGNNKAISYGSNSALQWADGNEDGADIEVIYGNGEICNNGIPRKAIVEYVCGINKVTAGGGEITQATLIDQCAVKIVIVTPNACPVETICANIFDSETCEAQRTCMWSAGTCFMDNGVVDGLPMESRERTVSTKKVFVFLVLGVGLLAGVCCFVSLLRRRRVTRVKRAAAVLVGRKEGEFEQMEFQVPFQLIPGGFAPNPYSDGQGYPMTTFLVPAQNQQV